MLRTLHNNSKKFASLCVAAFICYGLFAGSAFADTSAGTSSSASSSKTAAVLSTGDGQTKTTYDTPLEPGTYYIQSSLSGTFMLDVAGGSKADGANVQIWRTNNTAAQRWRAAVDENGLYTFTNVGTGKALDLAGGKADKGSSLRQNAPSSATTQKWIVRKNGNGFVLAAAENSEYVADVKGGSAKAGADAQLWKANGTAAQRWWFVADAPQVPSERTVENGVYELRLAADNRYTFDLSGQSYNNGANVQLWKANNSIAQRWAITWEKDGYYSVKSVSSGKPLDVAGGSLAVRANIQQHRNNNTAAQRWAIARNTDGSYTFISKASGMALDAAGAKAANGTNIRTYLATNKNSQRFTLKAVDAVPDGLYTVYTSLAPTSKAADMPNASSKNGTQAQLHNSNGTMAQKYQFRRVAANTYMVQNAISGKYLEDASGKVVQQPRNTSKNAQKWKASFEESGLVFTNVATAARMAVSGGQANNGAKLVTNQAAVTNAQRWRLASTNLLSGGYYTITNGGGNRLDVAGESLANGTNVQVWAANGAAAQIFKLVSAGGGYYSIVNDASSKAIDVKGASKANGANVQQYTANGTAAQQWKGELDAAGGVVLINKASGKALDVAGGSKANGANVQQYTANGTAAQRWFFAPSKSAGISGNAELDAYLRSIAAQNNYNLRNCYNWVTSNIRWSNSVAGEVLPNGIVPKATTIRHALYAFKYRQGDCYYYAAAFKWLAVACGESAQVRAGRVPSASRGTAAHGWTEVYRNGATYICDPNLQVDIGGYNWYMVTYATAPNDYYL